MALSKEVYKEFEDVVGEENICNDPAIMPSYYSTELSAVILPKNTAEVQAIVKLCNKHRLQFRAECTGWTFMMPGMVSQDFIYLDLRRMNRIIEINEKNMYAVVEPYVISAQLQAELFKRGLNFCIKGAGSNTSALLRGHGHLDQTTSGDDRNHLAVEWVTPEGEIVRSGALGSSDEWFCGDGPGPSLRCILNSVVPPGTTPGVFTKTATKLYHWPGPARYPIVGKSPKYTLSEVPPNMMVRYFSFPSAEKMYQAERQIGESEISYVLMGFNASMVSSNITTTNEEDFAILEQFLKEVQGPGFLVIIAGNSQEDFEYKKRALQHIVSEADGKSLEKVEDPEIEGTMLCQCTRISASIRETFRAGGIFTSIPIMGQRDLCLRWSVGAGKAKEPLIEKGLIVDDGAAFFGWGVEHGHLGKTEIFCRYDPLNPEAKQAVEEWHREQIARAFNEHYFAVTMGSSPEEIGPALSNYHIWWKKFKEAIDPNDVSPEVGALA
jgi:glycolate oxidase